ncbi:Predicted arabinose efflux permease, MFS family [Novosphingobium sp. CF614]|uniref:spinster family MFS transporter n=1 Tax=Novosphingobium sp. CF614 TaxID=1884364 RepID=UPI0008F3DE2B|nr:MFS transporter [Novosphingobium sp. CF614]SFF83006.1 Predicted arabinose efflux permease, MFS family [Novosphingobium sp. CF614]
MLDTQRTNDADALGANTSHGPPVMRISAASWYALLMLGLINCFAYTDRIGLSILMELIKHDLHLSDAQLGIVSGLAFTLFNVILGIPLAWVADRYSRVKLISICLALWSGMTALSGLAQSYAQLFLTRVGVGIGEAGCHPPAHSLIGDIFPREKRALGVGLFNAGAAVGVAGGMALIGLLGERFGWRGAMQIVGLMGLPLALLTLFTLREPPRPALHKENAESALRSVSALLRRPSFLHLVLALSIALVGTQGFSVWAPTFLMRSFGMGMVEVGAWIGGITAAFAVFGTVFGGVIIAWLFPRDARWEVWLPAGMVTICAPLFFLMVLAPKAWIVLLLKAFNTFFGAIGSSVAMTAVQSFAEPHRRATAVAIALLVTSLLGTGAGPYLIGLASTMLEPTFGKESLRYALLVTPAMLVWSIVHYMIALRTAVRDRVN